jgi:hypothetical protein
MITVEGINIEFLKMIPANMAKSQFCRIIYHFRLMFFALSSGEALTVQAPGTQTRSFCYVSDMVCKSLLFGLFFCGGFKSCEHQLGLGFIIDPKIFISNVEG